MSMRNIILLSLLGATSIQAATEFPHGLVPADVVSEFAGGTVLNGLPDDFPALTLPGLELQLIGSLQRNEYSQQLLLRSPLDREVLNASLLAALSAQGWTDVSSSPFSGVSGLLSLRLCHDRHGEMSINGATASYGTRIQVTRSVYPAQFTRTPCSEQQAQLRENAVRRSHYESLVPVLEVPEGTVDVPQPAIIRGASSSFSSSSFEIEREGIIQVRDTNAAELFEHFAAQLRAQGWEADSSNAGDASAASVWTRSVTPPGAASAEQVFASLTILRGDDANYAMVLTLRSPPAKGGGIGIGIVGVAPL